MSAMALAAQPDELTVNLPEVDEVPEIEGADVYQCGDKVILMIDGRPGALSRECAAELAWKLCSMLEATSH